MAPKAKNWNTTFEVEPANSDLVGAGNEAIQELKTAVQERLVQEHNMNLADTAPQARHGFHKPGSARAYVGTSAPTLLPDGVTALDVNDAGRLWFRTTDSTLWEWDGTTWKDVASVGAAPQNHATSATTYGVATTANYGHVKLHTTITDGVTDGAPDSNTVFDALALKADLASPTFSGTPSLPTGTTGVTQTAGDSSMKLATTAFAGTAAVNAVTTHDNLTSPHSAVSTATASRLVVRDGSGRAAFASPSATGDAATKGYVDGLIPFPVNKRLVNHGSFVVNSVQLATMVVGETLLIYGYGRKDADTGVINFLLPAGGTYRIYDATVFIASSTATLSTPALNNLARSYPNVTTPGGIAFVQTSSISGNHYFSYGAIVERVS
jgi:hypothetical protein